MSQSGASYPTKGVGCWGFWAAGACNQMFLAGIGFSSAPNKARPWGSLARHQGATGHGQTLEAALDVGITPMTGPGGLGHSCGHALHRVWVMALESLVSVSRKWEGAGAVSGKVCA
ncbi:hypothetical protein ACINB_02040 [Acidovorax sp. NB1]|nr:hypothetical protein ACINB_02040 [Acidovorax sp. NB1]